MSKPEETHEEKKEKKGGLPNPWIIFGLIALTGIGIGIATPNLGNFFSMAREFQTQIFTFAALVAFLHWRFSK